MANRQNTLNPFKDFPDQKDVLFLQFITFQILEYLQNKKLPKKDPFRKTSFKRLYNSSNNADKFGFLRQLDEQCVHIAREREKMFMADRDAKAKQNNRNMRLP